MATKKKAPARMWLAKLIGGKRPTELGIVWATDRESAEAEAVKQFELDDRQRKRLIIDEP
jgi:hypothetical protein